MSLPFTAAVTEGVGEIPGLVKKGAGVVSEIGSAARGASAKQAAEDLRSGVISRAQGAIASERGTAAIIGSDISDRARLRTQYENRIAEAERAQQQIAERNSVRDAQGRDTRLSPSTSLLDLRTDVTNRVRDRVRQAEREARDAGLDETEALGFASEQESKAVDAQNAADALDEEYRQRPGMNSTEFGDRIQKTAQAIQNKHIAIREQESGFGPTIASASTTPDIGTAGIKSYIRSAQQNLSANTRAILDKYADDIDTVVGEDGKAKSVPSVNLAKAESLRKDIESAIQTREVTLLGGSGKVNASEAVHYLRKIRSMLVAAAGQRYPQYIQALTKFRQLSRPLDLFQRTGALKDVVAQDLRSDEFKTLQADVVGRVVKRANAGSPALARLVSENPDLVNSARLYFNRELFGGERAPTAATLAKFLRENQGALDQLGLHDEFSTIQGARAAADRAISDAKQEAADAAAVADEAGVTRKQAGQKVGDEESLRKLAVKRQTEEEKNMARASGSDFAAQDRAAAATRRLEQTRREAERNVQGVDRDVQHLQSEQEGATKTADDIRDQISDLESLPPEQAARGAKRLVSKLRSDGHISADEYADLVDSIQSVRDKYGESKRAKQLVLKILGYAVGTGLIVEGLGEVRRRVF
jgi:hypothetical protein